jgi:hypothetical protein
MDQKFCMEKGVGFMKHEFMKHPRTGPRSWPEAACRMERWRGAMPKVKSTCIGHLRRSSWPRGIEIDSKKSWAPTITFMGVRPHPNPNEGS